MPSLPPSTLAVLLAGFYPAQSPLLLDQLSLYLDLLLKWNARTNLTAIRTPEGIVRTHFGESLFTALHLPPADTLLDLGSGAGFPGLPIQLALPHLRVTLAESQGKKASFLREVIRTLDLPTEVWPARIETLDPLRRFSIVTLRAVDDPHLALQLARQRVAPGGTIAHLTSSPEQDAKIIPIPGSGRRVLQLL